MCSIINIDSIIIQIPFDGLGNKSHLSSILVYMIYMCVFVF